MLSLVLYFLVLLVTWYFIGPKYIVEFRKRMKQYEEKEDSRGSE